MRLARIAVPARGETVAALVQTTQGEVLVDLIAASVSRGPPTTFHTMASVVEGGSSAMAWLQDLAFWYSGRQDPAWVIEQEAASWLTPLPPRAIIAAGRNFRAHRQEGSKGGTSSSTAHADFPTGFVKLAQTLVPHKSRICAPHDVKQMDYEVELAVVLSQPLHRASESQAREAIFGYTVFNDLSARDWQMQERRNNLLLVGKNLPGFGPLGPYILTADEVPDPSRFELSLSVNGEERQRALCTDMLFSVEELIVFWSRIGLCAGDIIATGTPEGVAFHRRPDPEPYFLKPGDVVRAAVSGIGVLETAIIDSE